MMDSITEQYADALGITLDEAVLELEPYEPFLRDTDPMTGESFYEDELVGEYLDYEEYDDES